MSVGEIDPNSAKLALLKETNLIGSAASIASAIRGQDLVQDARALEQIAAEQLDVNPYAFGSVVDIFEQMGWIFDVKRRGGQTLSFSESIPLHDNVYESLGDVWEEREPDEFEQQFVAAADRLARGPLPEEDLGVTTGIEKKDIPKLLALAKETDIAKVISTVDGNVLYSPYFFFGNADELGAILAQHGPAQLQDELGRVREYQGLPVDNVTTPAIADAVRRGLLLAPSVEGPQMQHKFACLPYAVDPAYLVAKRDLLNKALAVIACVRCGENFGGHNAILRPIALLDALLDPNRNYSLNPHSSAKRQYQLLFKMQVVDFIPSGSWVIPQLIATSDNIAAVTLARDLIACGEPITSRTKGAGEAQALLSNTARYRSPIETVKLARRERPLLSDHEFTEVMHAAFGYKAL